MDEELRKEILETFIDVFPWVGIAPPIPIHLKQKGVTPAMVAEVMFPLGTLAPPNEENEWLLSLNDDINDK